MRKREAQMQKELFAAVNLLIFLPCLLQLTFERAENIHIPAKAEGRGAAGAEKCFSSSSAWQLFCSIISLCDIGALEQVSIQ
jgi:hypothetical protein